jgi:hypothetical protein
MFWRLAVLIAAFMIGALGCTCPDRDAALQDLNQQLNPGDTRERVEEVLQAMGIPWSYDPFQHRYQAAIRDEARCGPGRGLFVTFALDSSNRLSKIDVSDATAWP